MNLWDVPTAYIVRVGKTDENGLTESGKQAAEAVTNFLSWQQVGRVICADVPGAYEMGQHILHGGNVACFHVELHPEERALEFIHEPYQDLPTVVIVGDEPCVVPGGIVAIYGDERVIRLGAMPKEVV